VIMDNGQKVALGRSFRSSLKLQLNRL